MSQKSIIIIGAGVGGLCTGIYGQMNGYQTRIYEKHKIPGGLLTAFRRKGYLVDLCIHWLTPVREFSCTDIGMKLVVDGREFLQHDRYGVYAPGWSYGQFLPDPDRLENTWDLPAGRPSHP
jgi:phytoene dehydrogenase-like protein